jgi:histidinol-phosphate aminotransferase
MSSLLKIVRDDVRALAAYHVPDASGLVKLDAMENPYTLPPELQQQLGERLGALALNRYPVPSYASLKAAIRTNMRIPAGFDVILGNGSDELITIVSTACAKPGRIMASPIAPPVILIRNSMRGGIAAAS